MPPGVSVHTLNAVRVFRTIEQIYFTGIKKLIKNLNKEINPNNNYLCHRGRLGIALLMNVKINCILTFFQFYRFNWNYKARIFQWILIIPLLIFQLAIKIFKAKWKNLYTCICIEHYQNNCWNEILKTRWLFS